jgi:integrase
VNGRKSLRRDADGNPRLDKVIRLDGFFERFRASEIDTDLLRKFIANQQARGLSSGSINRSLCALRRMLNLARQDGKLRDVPFFPMLKEATPRQGFFEREHYDALFAVLPDYLQLPVSIGYYGGMRLGEILSLTWSQVDFLRGVIHLLETKNGHPRDVPIVPQLQTVLEERYAKKKSECAFVCFRLDHLGQAVPIRGFRKAWYSACVKAGLGNKEPLLDDGGNVQYAPPRGPRSKPKEKMVYEGMIFHDLRRTGVRNLVRAGVSETVAMRISGHETASVFKRYDITSGKDFVEAGRKLEQFHSQSRIEHKSSTVLHQNAAGDLPIH